MASYILRGIDPDLFQRAKEKAAKQIPNQSLKAVIESLIAAWLDERPTVKLDDGCVPANYEGFPPQDGFKTWTGPDGVQRPYFEPFKAPKVRG